MVDRTQHCTGCKERQDRIDELEAALREIAGLSRWETMTQGCNAATDAVNLARAALGDKT